MAASPLPTDPGVSLLFALEFELGFPRRFLTTSPNFGSTIFLVCRSDLSEHTTWLLLLFRALWETINKLFSLKEHPVEAINRPLDLPQSSPLMTTRPICWWSIPVDVPAGSAGPRFHCTVCMCSPLISGKPQTKHLGEAKIPNRAQGGGDG